jgi:co-chaperonin GroES (HSP10)
MITPLGPRLVIRLLTDKQSGQIIIPDVVAQKQSGEVLSLGTGKVDKPDWQFTVKVGDRVMIHPHHVLNPTTIDGEELYIVREEDLLGIIEVT